MDINQQIIGFLSERLPALKGIYLFGSRAEGRARPDSDVDIAFLVEWGHSPTAMQQWEWSVELADMLQVEAVDLVGLQEASTDFRFVIVSTGQRIYCNDRAYCDTFDMIAYSMYQRLELERREIVEEVKKRGRIYG
ncbi:MAG: nucleotidyltransferase domain-containing protein [Phaeodactylibacter sp.]|nr:nucleotidyltransferase domain-containing protein [Phaeodactylibacter sp.]